MIFCLNHHETVLQDYAFFLFFFGFSFSLVQPKNQDAAMITRTGKNAFIIGIPAIVVPLMTGAFLKNMLYDDTSFTTGQNRVLPMLIGFHGMTSFPVVASLVKDLQILNSELGRLGLSSAIVSDHIGCCVLIAIGQANRLIQSQ